MKICKGVSASPGLVLGQVSRLERHVETFSTGPFDPERELRQLEDAVRTAQSELDSMAERAASTEQAILQFQSMMLDDEGMMNEVRFCIKAGISAAAAMDKVGQRYADQLASPWTPDRRCGRHCRSAAKLPRPDRHRSGPPAAGRRPPGCRPGSQPQRPLSSWKPARSKSAPA